MTQIEEESANITSEYNPYGTVTESSPQTYPQNKILIIFSLALMVAIGISAYLFLQNQSLKNQLTPSVTCEYEGETYEVGEGFTASDGCNSCSCTETGEVACTLMACEVESQPDTQKNSWNTYIDPDNRFSFQYPNEMYQLPTYQGGIKLSDVELSTSAASDETALRITVNPAQLNDIFSIDQEVPPGVFDQLNAASFFSKNPTIIKKYAGNPPFSYYAFFYPSDAFDTGNLVVYITIHKQDEIPVTDGGTGGRQAKLAGQILSTFEFNLTLNAKTQTHSLEVISNTEFLGRKEFTTEYQVPDGWVVSTADNTNTLDYYEKCQNSTITHKASNTMLSISPKCTAGDLATLPYPSDAVTVIHKGTESSDDGSEITWIRTKSDRNVYSYVEALNSFPQTGRNEYSVYDHIAITHDNPQPDTGIFSLIRLTLPQGSDVNSQVLKEADEIVASLRLI